jgi:hypothetical protein
LLIWLLVLVISDPYQGLNYNEINVYTFEKTYCEDCINVWTADGFGEGDPGASEESESDSDVFIPYDLKFLFK